MMVVLILMFMLIVDVGMVLVITLVLRLILVAGPKEIFLICDARLHYNITQMVVA